MASISLKIKILENLHTKSFEILGTTSFLLSFFFYLKDLRLNILNGTVLIFVITLTQPIPEMLGQINFLLLIWNLKNVRGLTRIKDKKEFD
jgi:hypothetical protein